jgi:hypothetical protein
LVSPVYTGIVRRLKKFTRRRYKNLKSHKIKVDLLKKNLAEDDFISFLEKHNYHLYVQELDNRARYEFNDFNKENEKILNNLSYSNEYKAEYLKSRHKWLFNMQKPILNGGLVGRRK